MKAAILTIGDELLLGQTVNSNAAWLGEQLDELGVEVEKAAVAGDEVEAIKDVLSWGFSTANLVITTGGLGPTHDDVTRSAVAEFFGRSLLFDETVYEEIEARFAHRRRSIPASNRTQAMVPEGFDVLPNSEGTAPGLWLEETGEGGPRLLAVLPGVPYEMKRLLKKEVVPRLQGHLGQRVIRHRMLLTSGIGESSLNEQIGDVSGLLSRSLRLAFLPGTGGVRLRLSAYGSNKEEVEGQLDKLEARLRSRIEKYIYTSGEGSLEAVVGEALRRRNLTLALAESCTGGYVANQFTNVSGASAYVLGGVVAYSNAAKTGLLNVDPAVLKAEGAVSRRVALQMARGVRKLLQADIGISTTGIAGPTGGTPEKPVGTVWIGYADASKEEAHLLRLKQDRMLNKALTSTAVLNLVRTHLRKKPNDALPESGWGAGEGRTQTAK